MFEGIKKKKKKPKAEDSVEAPEGTEDMAIDDMFKGKKKKKKKQEEEVATPDAAAPETSEAATPAAVPEGEVPDDYSYHEVLYNSESLKDLTLVAPHPSLSYHSRKQP